MNIAYKILAVVFCVKLFWNIVAPAALELRHNLLRGRGEARKSLSMLTLLEIVLLLLMVGMSFFGQEDFPFGPGGTLLWGGVAIATSYGAAILLARLVRYAG